METLPNWDADTRELRFGTTLVKRFREPAPTQIAILTAFQEERWPPGIDDPLSPKDHTPPKQRLRDTIRRLNRHQANRLIVFCGDGTGTRVLWRRRSESE
jgi:hypothetical protein